MLYFDTLITIGRVATVRGKSLENDLYSRSGKSQGIFYTSQGSLEEMGEVREFQNFPLNNLYIYAWISK